MLSVTEKERIVDSIEMTAEISGNPFKPQVIALMVEDLAEWEFNDIQVALNACRREVKGRLSLKDIIDRLPKKGDELPTADELWGQILEYLTDENKTFVLPEMAFIALESTHGGIYKLAMSGDKTGARMAFKAAYERLSQGYNGKVNYKVRLGLDKENQAAAVKTAYLENKITKQMALAFFPELDEMLGLLPPPNPENIAKVMKSIATALSDKVQK